MIRQPPVSIIIITTNQFDFVGNCLKSLLNSRYKNIRILLVDNNSRKENYYNFKNSFKQVKNISFFRLRKNMGFAGACNYALKKIKKGYIVFLNDDILVTRNWLNPIISYMENHPDVGACQPKIMDMTKKWKFNYAGAAGGFMDVYGVPFCRGRIFSTIEEDKNQYNSITDVVWCSGACFVTKASVIKKVGMLDEIFFMYGEEADLCWRMFFYDYRLVCIPNSSVYHYGSGTIGKQSFRKFFLLHRNGLILLFKNYTFLELIKYLPGRILLDFLAFCFYMLNRRTMINSLAVVAGYFAFICLMPSILEKRKNAAFRIMDKDSSNYPLYRKSIAVDYFFLEKKNIDKINYLYKEI